jgi:tetratricopeptide (TPR) repeat protein
LGTDDAVALFHRRAAAHPAHQPADWQAAEHHALRRLVDALEGMPLALELAAARASVMRPSALLERLKERFKLLALRGSPAGRPARQASLQATLDASWTALSTDEQAVLAQLSVFEGGFDAAAAQAVVQVPSDSVAWLPDLLQALQDKALLQTGSGGRFSLLRCVREHAAMHKGADAATRGRHALHFSQQTEHAAAAHHGLDLHNLLQACRHSVAGSQAEMAARTLPLAWAALRLVGPFNEAVTLADAVLALPGLDVDAQAAVWAVKAGALFAQGDMQAAGPAARQGQRAAEAGGDTALQPTRARLLCIQGEVAAAEGQHDLAEHCLAEARRLADACGDPATVCHALNSQGSLAFDRGQVDEARSLYEAGLTVATDARDHRWQCGLLSNLGAIHHQAGRLDEARDAFERALRFAQACGDQRFAGNARCNLGLVHHDQGRLADAELELQATLDMARQLGQSALEHAALCNLGMVLSAQGRHELACDLHADAVDGARAAGNLHAEGVYRTYLGTALARTGRFDEARACLRRGRELLAQANDAMNLGLLLCAVAECEQLARDWQDAEQALNEARDLLNRLGSPAESELARRLEAVARNTVGGPPPALNH